MSDAPTARHRMVASLIVLVAGSLVVVGAGRRHHAADTTAARHSAVTTSGTSGTGADRTATTAAASAAASSTTTVAPDPAALSAADAFVTAYAGYDWHHPSGDPATWRALVTPALYARLTGPAGSTTGMTAAQVARHESAVPAVRSTTWESGGTQSAAVLVDCVLTVTSDGSGPQQLATPYPLTLTHGNGGWLVAAVSGGTGG